MVLRAPPPWHPWSPRQLQRIRAAGMDGAHPRLGQRCLRVLQQRLGSVCPPQCTPLRSAALVYSALNIARANPTPTSATKTKPAPTTDVAAEKPMTPMAAPLLVAGHSHGDTRAAARNRSM